jgi:type IV pilus assembly protein PilB
MLNAQVSLADAPQEPSLVRALLSAPSPTGLHPIPRPPALMQEAETVRATLMMDHLTIPRLIAGLDLALRPLHPFEAYVISLIDGTYAVPTIARAAKLSLVEAQALFTSLRERGVIELQRKEEPPARPVRKAPPSPPPEPAHGGSPHRSRPLARPPRPASRPPPPRRL